MGPPPHDQHWVAIRDDRWKLIQTTLLGDFFYDLGAAPAEGDDLLAMGLNLEQQAAYDALRAQLPVPFP